MLVFLNKSVEKKSKPTNTRSKIGVQIPWPQSLCLGICFGTESVPPLPLSPSLQLLPLLRQLKTFAPNREVSVR